jgi:hypothetical protein
MVEAFLTDDDGWLLFVQEAIKWGTFVAAADQRRSA